MSFNTFVTDTFVTKVIVCHGKIARTGVNAFLYASIIHYDPNNIFGKFWRKCFENNH